MKKLTDNDPDLLLARKLGQAGVKGKPPLFLKYLMTYREGIKKQELAVKPNGDEVWAGIEKQTSLRKGYIYPMGRRSWILAAAASILIASFITLFFNPGNETTLIAQSGTEIEIIPLNDGSEVTLRPHSSLYELESNATVKRYRLEGEGYFDVANRNDQTFSVETTKGMVEVLGTRFVISDWGEVTEVFLEEGSVLFKTTNQSNSIVLEPGQSSSITKSENILPPQSADIKEFLDWTRNELYFNEKKARDVFNELEHHFQISIEAPDSISNEVLGGAISLERLKLSLEDLGTVLNGYFVTSDNKTYSYIPN
ncbi:MAG: FecR domain-containing protein [Balneolales bacterium]